MRELYKNLLSKYGCQGWWPILCDDPQSERLSCYHPQDYSFPRNESERLEICIGAILTQNTNWFNVEKALYNLKEANLISIERILEVYQDELAELIRSSGYYNQKARKLKVFCKFLNEYRNGIPARDELLSLWGIGKETADSILLYAYHVNIMVIDAYSRRVFKEYGYSYWNLPYDELRAICEKSMPEDYRVLQEFHALLVAAGKEIKLHKVKVG
ncbi:MAG: hypothetical protein RAO94_02280 [Candidatus Stygibacter australis]|nr:hypothetical protein [Candidatus Stygibacter australis]MDP8321159.1 hypothetical protein [Candidatus Stygibacter australis]